MQNCQVLCHGVRYWSVFENRCTIEKERSWFYFTAAVIVIMDVPLLGGKKIRFVMEETGFVIFVVCVYKVRNEVSRLIPWSVCSLQNAFNTFLLKKWTHCLPCILDWAWGSKDLLETVEKQKERVNYITTVLHLTPFQCEKPTVPNVHYVQSPMCHDIHDEYSKCYMIHSYSNWTSGSFSRNLLLYNNSNSSFLLRENTVSIT